MIDGNDRNSKQVGVEAGQRVREALSAPDASVGGEVLELTEANFKSVVNESRPTLVDFWAEWCGPCRMIAPTISELAAEFEDRANIGKVNVDEQPKIAEEFRVRSIPTLLFFRDGDVKGQIVGVQPKAKLAEKLESLGGA